MPETLVALLGLAIVVLGIVAVHAERLQTRPVVVWRADAAVLAEEFAVTVREAVLKPQYTQQGPVRFENPIGVTCRKDAVSAGNGYGNGHGNGQGDANVHGNDKSLSAVDIAANQVACWQNKIAAKLPNGNGTIAVDQVAVPQVYVITVSWSQGGGSTASFVLRTDISPQPVVATAPVAKIN